MSASASLDTKNVIGGDIKQAKFDRQLRLWGADGQAALEAAHVVAIGATPAIAEALKSLVLTGVPVVTLVDERVAAGEDVAVNYFVPASTVDTSLATAVLTNLCALGEECIGFSATISPEAWVKAYTEAVEQDWLTGWLRRQAPNSGREAISVEGASDAPQELNMEGDDSAVHKFVLRFPSVGEGKTSSSSSQLKVPLPSLILVSERYADLSPTSLLVQTCLHKCYPDVPVVLVRSSGLLGFLQVYCPYRVIVRPHNPTQVKMEDLRIFQPFPALKAWFDAHDPDDDTQFSTSNVDSMSLHSHLPYPCILYHAFHRWWASMSEETQTALLHLPSASSSFRAAPSLFPLSTNCYRDIANIVAGMIRRKSPPEDAFIEAMKKCTAKLNRPVVQQLPKGLDALLQDPHCANPLLAVEEMMARLHPEQGAPALHTASASVATLPTSALLLLWTSQEVLVWCILHAVGLFVNGKIGCEGMPAGSEERLYSSNTECETKPNEELSLQDNKEAPSKVGPPYGFHLSPYHLPFSGYLPDFTTTTMWYRELQDIYHNKHLEDVTCIAGKAWETVAKAAGITATNTDDEGDEGHTFRREEQLGRMIKALLTEYTTTIVENIWDLRMVSFSTGYLSAQEPEWRKRLGHRLIWITHMIADDVERNASARRAACLAVAYLCKEELQRLAAHGDKSSAYCHITGQMIAEEAAHLASLTKASDPATKNTTTAPGSFPAWLAEDTEGKKVFQNACVEVARWAGGGNNGAGASVQLPSVAASTGALAAQEAVKLIMRIRVPCGQPIMYDGYTNKVYTL